jgi:hypothetical protein
LILPEFWGWSDQFEGAEVRNAIRAGIAAAVVLVGIAAAQQPAALTADPPAFVPYTPPPQKAAAMQRWRAASFGLFLHFEVYSTLVESMRGAAPVPMPSG